MLTFFVFYLKNYERIDVNCEHDSYLNLTSISYSFWNKGQKVLTFWKFDEKSNNSKLGTQINFKIAGYVDLDMLHICLPFFHPIFKMLTFFVFYLKNYERIDVNCKLKTCSVCEDLHALHWNKGQKVLTFWKFDEKSNNSKLGTQINLKIAGYVDLDMTENMFSLWRSTCPAILK
jgi:hypothetical protein